MAHRYFLDSVNENTAIILGDEAKHLIKVMRVKILDELVLTDKKGFDYITKVKEINQNEIHCEIIKKEKNLADPKKQLTVFMALPKSDKLEMITQKLCELGVFDLTPFVSEFCVAQKSKKEDNKLSRLQKISDEAAKQSARSVPMRVKNTLTYKEFLSNIKTFEKVLLFYEKKDKIEGWQNLKSFNNVAIVIGSEGGFSKREVDDMIEMGAEVVNLGNRILRCETAAITATSLVQYELGELE